MTAEPPFVLCGPAGVVIADGVQACYRDVAAAQSALRSGAASIVLGALPFDVDGPAALMAPRSVRHADELPDWPTGPMPAVQRDRAIPAPDEHRDRVRRALRRADRRRAARCRRWCWPARCSWPPMLHWTPGSSCAGWPTTTRPPTATWSTCRRRAATYAGTALVGASPELLVARDGDRVTLPAVRRVGAACRRPRSRRRRGRRARRFGQGSPRASVGDRHHGRGLAAAVQRVDDRPRRPR